tara:strand:- start:822 stop:1223 length:402 start_codon:yes stop_codon:yes gene_type:complete
MKNSLLKILIFVIPISFLIYRYFLNEINTNKETNITYGTFISKPTYMVWGDLWPFKVNNLSLFCKNSDNNFYIYIQHERNFYALNKKTKDKLGFDYPHKIWRDHPNFNLTKNRINFPVDHIIDRGEALCEKFG